MDLIKENNKKQKQSLVGDIVNHLRKYGSLSSIQGYQLYNTIRLGSIIHYLRKHGFEIRTEIVHTKNRYGNTTHYAIYYLEKEGDEEYVF